MADRSDLIPSDTDDILETLLKMRQKLERAFSGASTSNGYGNIAAAQIADAYAETVRLDLELRRQKVIAESGSKTAVKAAMNLTRRS